MNNKTFGEPDLDRMANPIGLVERPLELTVNAWIAALRTRGITFTLVNNRLRVSPWSQLSIVDLAVLRQHRNQIKELVRKGPGFLSAAPTLEKHRNQNPNRHALLKKSNLEAWRVVHFYHPDEIERRRVEATLLMTRVRRPRSQI